MNRSPILRVLTGLALLGVAIVHLDVAGSHRGLGKHPLSLSDQFYAQSAIAVVLALALVVKPHLLVWLASAAFGVGSLAVLVYSRYKTIPIYGFPAGFQESWMAKGAKQAAVFEGFSIVLALAGTALARQPRAGQRSVS